MCDKIVVTWAVEIILRKLQLKVKLKKNLRLKKSFLGGLTDILNALKDQKLKML